MPPGPDTAGDKPDHDALVHMNPTIGLAARTNPGLRCPASGPHAEADAKFSPEKNDFYFERFAPVPSALAAKRLGRHQ